MDKTEQQKRAAIIVDEEVWTSNDRWGLVGRINARLNSELLPYRCFGKDLKLEKLTHLEQMKQIINFNSGHYLGYCNVWEDWTWEYNILWTKDGTLYLAQTGGCSCDSYEEYEPAELFDTAFEVTDLKEAIAGSEPPLKWLFESVEVCKYKSIEMEIG